MTIEGVIPNSQVVIVPWQPDDVHDASSWTKQLFLMPGRWIPWVGVTLVTTILILAITVLVLHLNEKVRGAMLRLHHLSADWHCARSLSGKTSLNGGEACILLISMVSQCYMILSMLSNGSCDIGSFVMEVR